MLLLWFLFPLIFFIYEIKKHINYFIALCSFQNDKFEKSAAPFESCKFRPLHEHLRSGTLNNLWEDFFFGEWNNSYLFQLFMKKTQRHKKKTCELRARYCSFFVPVFWTPNYQFWDYLKVWIFQFHEPWHGFLKPLRRPANMTRNKSFEKYLILVYYGFFFLFSLL